MTRTGEITFRIHGQRKVTLPPFKPRQGLCPDLPSGLDGPGMAHLQVLLFVASKRGGSISEATHSLAGYREGQSIAVEELGRKILGIAADPGSGQYLFQTAANALIGLTGVEGIIALLSAPGISENDKGFVAGSTFGVLEDPEPVRQSLLRGLSADELDLLGRALQTRSLQPYHAGFKLALSLNAGSAAQIKLLYRRMIMNNPRWRVYLSLNDIQHVGRMLGYPNDETVFDAATQRKVAIIYGTVTKKKLNLFTSYGFSENAKGFALRRVISMVLYDRYSSFGTSTQRRAAKGFAIKDEWSSADKGACVLRRMRFRRDFFDPRSGQLKAELRQRILAVRTKYPKDLLDAVEELEELFRGIS